ncbi:MFS transporter [Streptomyces sp. NPDC059894]|uniref:MFS transporter n=1 Tax=unclassified Streptomyces TaxID=2593676 RepID=UPI00365A4579
MPVSSPVASLNNKLAVFALAMGLTYGYDGTAMAGALLQVTSHFNLGTAQQGTLFAAAAFGMIAGAVLGGRLANGLGRRVTLIGLALLYTGAALTAATSQTLIWLDGARFVQGTAIGISIVVAPIFIAESATTQARGRIAVLYQVATAFGAAGGYFGGYLLGGGGHWRIMLIIPGLIAVLAALTLLPLPEPARWKEAQQTVPPGSRDGAAAGSQSATRTLKTMISVRYRTLTFFVIVLGFFVQATGVNAMEYFSPRIFEHMGYTDSFGLLILPGTVQLAGGAAAFTCAMAIDRVGRRPALLTGTALMAAGHALMVAVFADALPEATGFVGLTVFTIGFNAGFGSLVWIFAAEGFPPRLRSVGASAMLLTNLTTNLLIAQFFLGLLTAAGGTITYLLLLAITIAAWLFVFFLAPETKNRSLEEVQGYWENGRSWLASTPLKTHPDRVPAEE